MSNPQSSTEILSTDNGHIAVRVTHEVTRYGDDLQYHYAHYVIRQTFAELDGEYRVLLTLDELEAIVKAARAAERKVNRG